MRTIGYNLKQAFLQIGRNKGMSLASVFAITAMMLILGLFFVITVNVNLFSEMLKSEYDEVEFFLEDGTDADEAQAIMDKFENEPGVQEVAFRSKDDAMKIMKQRWGENGYLLDSLGDNPLPDSVLVTVDSPENASKITEAAEGMDGIEDVKYYKETVEKLTSISDSLQIGALVVMAFLIVVSVVVVSNTIKLTVFARAREISIMKYIGASNWFIRGPFLVEGIIIGIFSALVSAGVTYLIYDKIVDIIGTDVMTILSCPMVPATYLAMNLVAVFAAMGVSIGACGSIISMRRFLDT